MLDFDVTRRPLGNLKLSDWTQSVNLMCNLLHGIDYQALYGEEILTPDDSGRHLFDNLLQNVSHFSSRLNVDADGNSFPVDDVLTDAFRDIKMIIETFKFPIKLGDFFSSDRIDTTDPESIDGVKNFIIDRLELVRTSYPAQMRHFCTPFVEVQKGRALKSTLTDMSDFLAALGGKTLKQFHTSPRTTPKQGDAIKKATEAGILRAKPIPGQQSTLAHNGNQSTLAHDGNGKWCCNGNCVASGYPLTWCLEVYVNGIKYCALGSDSDPNCTTTACG